MRHSMAGVTLAGLLAACSGGQLGASGKVRFSQVVHFAETGDFSAPIVTGSGLLLQLEDPTEGTEQVDPTLSLVVADEGSGSPSDHAEVLPLGFAQYAIELTQGGNYTLIAEKNGAVLDTLGVSAAGAAGLHWHDHALVTITGNGNNASCASVSSVALGSLVLSPNSSIALTVVPDDGNGNALLGMLQLTAQAQGPAVLTGGFLGQGLTPNALTVAPQGDLGSTVHLSVSDAVTGKSLSLDIPTQTGDATPSCD